MVINLCIDEFEEACRGLRSTAAADAELRRRMQQRGHGQFVAGDGMLIARIQQGGLSDAAFVDIVQKFKFALNLLVRCLPMPLPARCTRALVLSVLASASHSVRTPPSAIRTADSCACHCMHVIHGAPDRVIHNKHNPDQ